MKLFALIVTVFFDVKHVFSEIFKSLKVLLPIRNNFIVTSYYHKAVVKTLGAGLVCNLPTCFNFSL